MPQILYTPLHWLAYWNDHKSIEFLLSTVSPDDKEKVKYLFKPNDKDLTPLDFAGVNNAFESIQLIISYFRNNFEIIEWVFSLDQKDGQKGKANQVGKIKEESEVNEHDFEFPWVITKVKTSHLTRF